MSPAATQTKATGLLVREEGRAGRITLDRPRRLNMLTAEMVEGIDTALSTWQHDPGIALVIIDASGERAFSAGGDIAAVHGLVAAGDTAGAFRHCLTEYRLDLRIARFGKPVVTLVDAVAMGGGIGIACHAAHRVVTPRAAFSLPECAIGWLPDSGATHLIAGIPAPLAAFLALTGTRIGAADAIDLGFADTLVATDSLPELVAALCATGDPARIAGFGQRPGTGLLAGELPWIEATFAAPGVPEILRELETPTTVHADSSPHAAWRETTSRALRRGSPLSLALALAALDRARRRPGLEAALTRESRVISRLLAQPDFREGVRAAMIDRDRKPRWQGAHEVAPPPQEINGYFEPTCASLGPSFA